MVLLELAECDVPHDCGPLKLQRQVLRWIVGGAVKAKTMGQTGYGLGVKCDALSTQNKPAPARWLIGWRIFPDVSKGEGEEIRYFQLDRDALEDLLTRADTRLSSWNSYESRNVTFYRIPFLINKKHAHTHTNWRYVTVSDGGIEREGYLNFIDIGAIGLICTLTLNHGAVLLCTN